jgi:RHS repeat-associated protein
MAAFAAVCASAAAQVLPLDIRSVRPPSGSGYETTLRLTVSDGKDGSSVSRVGVYVGSDSPERGIPGCLAYWDRNANSFFLGHAGGWHRAAVRGGAAVENGRCRIVPAESRVTADGDPVTVEIAVQFLRGFEGTKLVYGYADSYGDTRNTGWQEVGTWRVLEEGVQPSAATMAAAASTVDPNDLPTAELSRPDTPYQAYLKANPGVKELAHERARLNFQPGTGKRAAVLGPVTHQDQTTGNWVPNAPVLSATNNGWRVDGSLNSLLIKKQGTNQHSVTQTYSDFTTKHDSTLTVTLPSLVYDGKTDFHYVQDGLTWKLGVQQTGAMNLVASVAAKRGPKTYSFDVSSSETLSVDAEGNLIGDGHIVLTRAVMIPKSGKRVFCSAWTYSKKDGASFTCDDSNFQGAHFPYLIDPQSQTWTDGGTYHLTRWSGWGYNCGCDDSGCHEYCYAWGGDEANAFFNTSGLIPGGGSLLGTSCGFHSFNETLDGDDHVTCELPNGFNNSGNTRVRVWIWDNHGENATFSDNADVDNVSLTVTYTTGVSITISPSSMTQAAGASCCNYGQSFCATVDSPNTAATFTTSPANIGTFYRDYNLATGQLTGNDHCNFYQPPAMTDGTMTISVVATATADPSKTATASLTITAPPASVSISPGGVTLRPSQQQQFSTSVTNRVTQTVSWSLTPNVGTITGGGLYTAPATITAPQNVTLRGTSVDGSAYSTVTISLLPPISVTVAPGSAALGQGQTQQFTANVQYAGTAVTWSRSPAVGSIDGSGLYSAPTSLISSPQTVTITATSAADGVTAGTATVTVMPVAVSVTPALSTMNPSRTNQMTATVGYTTNPAVTWSMVSGPGAINAYGVYTSPITVASNQTVTVRATSVADPSKTATASFTVTPWAAGTPYQYYVTDAMTAINGNYWGINGSAAASSGGLTASGSGGSVISRLAVADGSNDYEVEATVHVPNPVNGGVYSVLTRASADANPGYTGTYYSFNMEQPTWDAYGCSAMFTVKSVQTYTTTLLAQLPFTCHDGMKLRMIVRGSSITVGIDTGWAMTLTDSSIPAGQPAFYINPQSGATISSAMVGAIDAVAPGAVASPITTSAMPSRVDLRWTASADDNAGSGMAGYQISRDGVVLGTTAGTTFTDETATPGTATTYSIVAFDWHGNNAAATTKTVTPPTSPSDPRRIGVRPTGAYWGAAGEQIDVMSGNLNFALPLFQLKARTGWGVNFMLSYSSQTWRQDAGGVWNLGKDIGYGYGWRLQAGSLVPVIYNGSVLYVIFTDATGAEYRLDQDNGNMIFRAKDGLHLWYEWGSNNLYFPDGSKWYMGSVASSLEQDTGTRYPTYMFDTNGNYVQIDYQAGAGSTSGNTSARISRIMDSRGGYYYLTYSGGAVPHLIASTGPSLGEAYTFSYSGFSLADPFVSGAYGTWQKLVSVGTTGLGAAHQFGYNGTGELTQATTPLGGTLGWSYCSYTYSGPGIAYREVQSRTMSSGTFSGAMSNTWNMTTDTGASQHATWTVSDAGANSSKVWVFASGLPASYEERGPGGTALMHTDYTWTTDAVGNPYVGTVVNTANPGANQVQSKSTQTLDAYGNLTQSAVYDFGNLTTPVKTYNYTYLHNVDGNYDARYIRNRVTNVTVTPAGGGATTLVSNTYDVYSTICAGNGSGMVVRTGAFQHDDGNYGTSFTYRGNVTSRSSMGSSVSMRYESTGIAICTMDGAGRSISSAPDASTGYSLPGVLTPGGNSNLATTVTYASSWQVTSVTGPNGAQGKTDYDGYGRPSKTKIPDGAETNYAYAYVGVAGATANTQTATIGDTAQAGYRWKKTTLDGFGRVIRVETGHDTTTMSQVDTQYAACACSPLGKLWRVSQPYAPGGTPVWTTYAYDGSGRTVSVTLPDGSATATQYLTTVTDPAGNTFTGSMVKTTDAAGKWKIQRSDRMGNLVQVLEPNPDTTMDGRYLTTNYTYNAIGQMMQVKMRRYPLGSTSTYTEQTRTFEYNGKNLVAATNPETGRVTYEYDGDGHVTKKTDAKGWETRYSYDSYGRLTQVQHWAWQSAATLQELTDQRIDYYYDTNPCGDGSFNGQNTWGRLTAVNFQASSENQSCVYQYSYNQAGRVTSQKMLWKLPDGSAGSSGPQTFDMTAGYEWDNEGRMTAMTYPEVRTAGKRYTYGFDEMGRANAMIDGTQTQVSATYGVAGEVLSMGYFGRSESRTYNNMFQMTRQTVTYGSTWMDMQYVYMAGLNNGRIAKSIDGVTGETVDYTYDVWNRLVRAETEGTAGVQWGQAFTYDGFGNLNAKTATKGTAPTFNTTIDPTTNGGPTSYDPHQIPDGSTDVEGRPLGSSTVRYFYDHAGKRLVTRTDIYGFGSYPYAATYEVVMYGLGGQRIATAGCSYDANARPNCGVGGNNNVYFAGKMVMSRGVIVATDRLGSVRANGNGESFAYYPYGEERTSTADGREKFGTYVRDNAGQDYADQRYYNVGTGRFNVPDPVGSGIAGNLFRPNFGAVNPRVPSSWNRYVYAGNDPINHHDPSGLCYFENGSWWDDDDPGSCNNLSVETVRVTVYEGFDDDGLEFAEAMSHRLQGFEAFVAMFGFSSLAGGYSISELFAESAFSGGADSILLGRYSDGYVEIGRMLGADVFEIPSQVWAELVKQGQEWAFNQAFIDAAINAGKQIIFLSDPTLAAEGTGLATEWAYLEQLGYKLVQEGTSWVARL